MYSDATVFDDDEKRCLFTTQIIEHTAYSLLIRVDNGLF